MERQRLRFTLGDDIVLLKEVLAENPFEDNTRWVLIHKKMIEETQKNFTIRAIKDHLHHITKTYTYKKEDTPERRKSGTEEEWAELKRLLQDVIVLSREFNGPENTYSPRTAQNRDASSALDLLKERHKDEKIMKRAEIEIKSKQLKLDEETLSYQKENLELEKQRLELERKKFELECKEREVRLQMEMEEREDRLQADREQRQILMSLLKKILEK